MGDVAWIAEQMHWATHLQNGAGGEEPLCAVLTGVTKASMTHDMAVVTCHACKAMDIAMTRGKQLRISLGLAKKPVIRLGVRSDPKTLAAIKRIENFPGTHPLYFFADEGNVTLWLVVAADDENTIRRLLDVADLPVKSHGEHYE